MLTFQLLPIPEIETDRLVLRQVRPSDADDVFYLRSHPQLMHFIPRPMAARREDALELIEKFAYFAERNEGINWAITRKGEDKLIGVIGYVRIQPAYHRAEVGYLLHDGYHGQGIMREALSAVLQHGFDVYRFHSVEAIIDPANTASEKVLTGTGFVQEGYFREASYWNGRFSDIKVFSMLTPHRCPAG